MRRFEREDHRKNSLDRLELAVAGIHDSESFRRYLTVQARFHQYSPNNVLLIMSQRPDAQKVAGYRTWQSLGRQVLRGEKAIRIIAPTTSTTEEDREDEPRGIGFRSVPVFDISQTDGKPLPAFQVPLLYSDEGEELYRQLEGLATDEQVKVARGHDRFRLSRTMMGFYLPGSREIFLREAPQLQMTKTLAHELGHHFSAHKESTPSTETEAEGISYVVLAHFGFDSGERSFPYVATWAKDRPALRAALGNIQRVSGVMIDRIEGPTPLVERKQSESYTELSLRRLR